MVVGQFVAQPGKAADPLQHLAAQRDRRAKAAAADPITSPNMAPGRKAKLMCIAASCDHNPPVGTPL